MNRLRPLRPYHNILHSPFVLQTAWRHDAATETFLSWDEMAAGLSEGKSPPSTPKKQASRFDTNSLNLYSTTVAPNPAQLKEANRFFTAQAPALIFSNAQFRLLPQSHHPEVTFLGRSNVGKSSLLNALFNRSHVAFTSSKPGKTRLMNAFGVSPHQLSAGRQSGTKGEIMNEAWRRLRGGCLVVDMPGYGALSRGDWGIEIMKYLEQRRQLRRAFVLIDSEHGLKRTDLTILTHLFRKGIPHTLVLSKVDKLVHPHSKPPSPAKLKMGVDQVGKRIEAVRSQLKKEVWSGRDVASDILCVSSQRSLDELSKSRVKIGIDELRWSILCSCGLQDTKQGSAVLDSINILDD